MLKFHVANAIWMESHFWNYVKAKKKKTKKKLYLYRQEILLNLRKLEHFNIAQYNQQLETKI